MTDNTVPAQNRRNSAVHMAMEIVKHSELRKNTIQEYVDEVLVAAGKIENFVAGTTEASDK